MKDFEFTGELRDISPSLLLNKDKTDRFQSFFLILGMIFNDLKGLLLIREVIQNNFTKPDVNVPSVPLGEYSGLIIQNDKFLIASTAEFFTFLDKYKDVISSPKFLIILKKLDPKIKSNWSNLVYPTHDTSNILSKIARIRSNISFHYDQSAKELRNGFIRSFLKERKELILHKKAYYSVGKDMHSTRFFFSDAAVEDYIQLHLDEKDINKVGQAIHNMNTTIQALLVSYIKSLTK